MRAPEAPTVASVPPSMPRADSSGAPPSDANHAGVNSGIHFEAPKGWAVSDREVMFAQVVWDFPNGGGGTLSVVGGGFDANLQRWEGPDQFQFPGGAAAENRTLEDIEGATYPTKMAVLKGTLVATSMIGGGPPRENWMLVCAGVSKTPLQNDIYLKVAGPVEDMEAQLPAIRQALKDLDIH